MMAISFLFVSCKKEAVVVLTESGLNPALFRSINNDGQKSDLFVMKNSNGVEVCVTNTGMRIVSMIVPDKEGVMRDVVLGFDKLTPYEDQNNYFGAITGRYTNRIANGKFTLDRVHYELRKKADDPNALHGGPGGFHTRYFTIEQVSETELKGTYLSKNKEEGFPGDFHLTVTYQLTADNALSIQYEGTTNMATVVNISNHSYFNLSGDLSKPVSDHILFINADKYTPVDENMIPTGELAGVIGTCMDFTTPAAIDSKMSECGNYDLNYVLNEWGDSNTVAAKVYSPSSGISMEVYTNEPGMQFYIPENLNIVGKGGITYGQNSSLCLETQHFPDSPNHENFPSTALRAGDYYISRTIYKFGIEQ